MRSRGFSLLEVMVAVAILGLALTVILSAQGGLAASNKMAGNMGVATTYARCKMTELEEKLLRLGYPLNDDDNDEVPCCNDNSDGVFRCDTKVEKILLPNPPQNSVDGGSSRSADRRQDGGRPLPAPGRRARSAALGTFASGLSAETRQAGPGSTSTGASRGLERGSCSSSGAARARRAGSECRGSSRW